MTAQSSETIIYEDKEYGMAYEPLSDYLENLENPPFLYSPSTACWRGYYGTWEVKGDKLYLIKLIAFTEGWKEADIEYIFPGQREAFADWFTGEIRIPQGELLSYIHQGYDSVYEKDIFLAFHKGILINERIEDNRNKVYPEDVEL